MTTKRIVEDKFISHTITRIHNLKTTTFRAKVEIDGKADSITGVLKKNSPVGYRLTCYKDGHGFGGEIAPPAVLKYRHHDIRVDNLWENRHGERINSERKKCFHFWKMVVGEFEIGRNPTTTPCYLRTVIPLSNEFNWKHIFELNRLKSDCCGMTSGLLQITIAGLNFDVYPIDRNQDHYLVVDGCQPMELEVFRQYCWLINVGISFFNSQLCQDEQFIFCYSESTMQSPFFLFYESLRPTITSIYHPTTSNAASWLRDDVHLYNEYKGRVKPVTMSMLNHLCNLIYRHESILIAILLLIESKRASMLMMPAGFAIILEGLATLFEDLFPEATSPIKDRTIARKIRTDLLDVLSNYEGNEVVNTEILKKKIESINSPTNKDRLKIPFQLLNIPLFPEDEKALNYRNELLHGNVGLAPLKKEIEMKELELAMRLLTLANAIILKLIGYDGWSVNHAKTQEGGIGRFIDEPYYRDLGGFGNIHPSLIKWMQTQ